MIQSITVDLIPNGKMPMLHASQYDDGRQVRINLTENRQAYTLTGNEVLSLAVRKADNTLVTMDIANTYGGKSYVEFATTEQMCAVAGLNFGELTITNNGTKVGSLNFYLACEPSPEAGGLRSASEINNLNRQIDDHIDEVLPDMVEDIAPAIVEEVAPAVVREVAPSVVEDVAPAILDRLAPRAVAEAAPAVVAELVPPAVAEVAPSVVREVAQPIVEELVPIAVGNNYYTKTETDNKISALIDDTQASASKVYSSNKVKNLVGDVQNEVDNVTTPSKNLYNKELNLLNSIMSAQGVISSYSGWQVSDKIPVEVGESYTISVYPLNATGPRRVGLFASNDNLVRIIDNAQSLQTVVIDSGVAYIRLTGSNNTMSNNKIQVEHNTYQTYYETGLPVAQNVSDIEKITDDLYGGAINFLEQGNIASGVFSSSTTAVRTSRLLSGKFSITVNSGYRIRKAEFYNKETGVFDSEIVYTDTITTFENKGVYDVRLVFTKTNPNSDVAYTENIIKSTSNIVALFRSVYDRISEELFADYELEQGTITDGNNGSSTNRVRFKTAISSPFAVVTNSGFVIRFVVLYDKTTGDYVGTTTGKLSEYTSLGDYAIRLVFAKSDLETAITPADNIIKNYSDALEATEKIASLGYAEMCDIVTLPNPKTRQLARTPIPYGLLWSDNYSWRKSSDNSLAVSSTAYKTIKVSNGSEISSNNKTQVNNCYSMTKVLTAVLLVENVLDLSQTITVNSTDIGGQTPTSLEMHLGDTASYEVMLNCSLIYSDNIATDCIARNLGYVLNPLASNDAEALTAFFNAMSAKATALGMSNTSNFVSPHGQMKSTPEDMCKLFKYVQDNLATIKTIWKKLTYTVEVTGADPRTWEITSTTDSVDREIIPEFGGGKTGSSDTLGAYGFVWKSDTDEALYITVLMNSPIANRERFYNARQIINEAYSLGV